MHLCYIDDSGDEHVRAFSLISIPVLEWHACFKHVKAYRRAMKEQHGIYVMKELHATEFVSGRGKVADEQIAKPERSQALRACLGRVSSTQSRRSDRNTYFLSGFSIE